MVAKNMLSPSPDKSSHQICIAQTKSVTSCTSNSNFYLITQKSFIVSCSYWYCIFFFLTSGFMYTYAMLILINGYLLNAIFSITKELNGQNSSQKSFHFPHLLRLFWKLWSSWCFFFSFCLFLFHSKLYKIPPATLHFSFHALRANRIIDSKLVWTRQMKNVIS